MEEGRDVSKELLACMGNEMCSENKSSEQRVITISRDLDPNIERRLIFIKENILLSFHSLTTHYCLYIKKRSSFNKVTAWIRIYKIVFHIKNDRNALYARTRSSMQCSHNERYYIMADAKFADATCS